MFRFLNKDPDNSFDEDFSNPTIVSEFTNIKDRELQIGDGQESVLLQIWDTCKEGKEFYLIQAFRKYFSIKFINSFQLN